MRRLLTIMTALALAVAMVAPAGAKGKPPKPDPPTPACESEMLHPVMGFVEFECDWTPENDGSQTGVVNVKTLKGEVTRLVMFVRDSSPGDICVLEQLDKPIGPEVEAVFPLVSDGEDYWTNPIHWCERFDPIAGQREDFNGEPLHLRVNVRGKRGTEILISLYGQTP